MYANYNPLMGFVNPILYGSYEKHLKTQFGQAYSIQSFFEISETFYKSITEELVKNKSEYILVDDYLKVTKSITLKNKTQMARILSQLINNQNEFINDLLTVINTLNSIISDDNKTSQLLKQESDAIKRTYLSTVIDLQKKLLLELKDGLEKAKESKLRLFSKIPILNAFTFAIRLNLFKRIERAGAATNILVLRLTKFFDKDKMKKEINQTYEEFAKAGILKPSRSYDKYNKYIGQIIKP